MNQPTTVLKGSCPYCKGLQHRSPSEVFQRYYSYDSNSMLKCFFCKQNISVHMFTPIHDDPQSHPGITNEKIVIRGDDLDELKAFESMIKKTRPKALYDVILRLEEWANSHIHPALIYDDLLFKQDGKHTIEIVY